MRDSRPGTRLKQARKILCRSRRTSSSTVRQLTAFQSSSSSSGPFTVEAATAVAKACPVIASNLPFCSGDRAQLSSKAHLAHVSSLSGPSSTPGIRPVIRDHDLEGPRGRPGFPVPFGSPALASWAILFPPRNSVFLTVDLPNSLAGVRTSTGFPRSTCASCVRVGRPLCPGAVVLTRPVLTLRPSPAASQRPALHPSGPSHLRGST